MHLEEHILEIFIVALMESGTESHGKNLIRGIIAQVIMMLVLINMVLNVKHRKDFGKIKVRLMK